VSAHVPTVSSMVALEMWISCESLTTFCSLRLALHAISHEEFDMMIKKLNTIKEGLSFLIILVNGDAKAMSFEI